MNLRERLFTTSDTAAGSRILSERFERSGYPGGSQTSLPDLGFDGRPGAASLNTPIRTLCSWCPAVIVDVPAPADGRLSHGCCPSCLERLLAA